MSDGPGKLQARWGEEVSLGRARSLWYEFAYLGLELRKKAGVSRPGMWEAEGLRQLGSPPFLTCGTPFTQAEKLTALGAPSVCSWAGGATQLDPSPKYPSFLWGPEWV